MGHSSQQYFHQSFVSSGVDPGSYRPGDLSPASAFTGRMHLATSSRAASCTWVGVRGDEGSALGKMEAEDPWFSSSLLGKMEACERSCMTFSPLITWRSTAPGWLPQLASTLRAVLVPCCFYFNHRARAFKINAIVNLHVGLLTLSASITYFLKQSFFSQLLSFFAAPMMVPF